MAEKIVVQTPTSERHEMEIDGAVFALKPTLMTIARMEQLREDLRNNQVPDGQLYHRLGEILRPAMRNFHTEEDIDEFFERAGIEDAMALIMGMPKHDPEVEAFLETRIGPPEGTMKVSPGSGEKPGPSEESTSDSPIHTSGT